jgi:hypothetical protein
MSLQRLVPQPDKPVRSNLNRDQLEPRRPFIGFQIGRVKQGRGSEPADDLWAEDDKGSFSRCRKARYSAGAPWITK